jgi:hypothetical protein
MSDLQGFIPQPERRLITTRREYLDGLDLIVAMARRELVLFDPDLVAIEINAPARIERLGGFLAANRDNRLRIAVHDADPLKRSCPRLLGLLAQHSAAMAIHQTEGEATRAQDCFMLADAEHFVRRGVAAQPRGAIGLHEPREGRQMHDRFEEIWQNSTLVVAATTLGL